MSAERNGWRDLTYHLEHRRCLPAACEMVDLDTVGYAPGPKPLYVAEVAYAPPGPFVPYKPAPVTGMAAQRLGIPGYVVQYQTERPLEHCSHCGGPLPGSAGAITRVHVRDARYYKSARRSMPAVDWWAELQGLYR